jgi:hypothetical protein
MQQKENGPVGSGAQARNREESSFEDKYVALQHVNQKLLWPLWEGF